MTGWTQDKSPSFSMPGVPPGSGSDKDGTGGGDNVSACWSCQKMGRAAKIAAAAVPNPVAKYAGEAPELRAHHNLLLGLASWWAGLSASIS